MDGLNPCLDLIMEVRQALECGESVRTAVRRFSAKKGTFNEICGRWLMRNEKGGDPEAVLKELKSVHRRSLLRLLSRGLRGEPIASALRDFENEIVGSCRGEMDRHLALLPLQMMVPLLLLIMPALLILLLGPLLESLAKSLGGF